MREARGAFRRFWPLTRGDRGWMLVIVACVVVSALAETAAILLFAHLTDTALQEGSLSAFWGPAGAWLGVAVLGALVGYLGNSLATWTAERFVLRLRANVFRHVQDLPPHFFQRHRRGDLVERLTGDVEAIEQMVVSGVVGTISAAFSAVFYSAAALYLRWDLALATFVLAPLFLLAARRFSGRIRQAARDERVAAAPSPPWWRSRWVTSSSPRRTTAAATRSGVWTARPAPGCGPVCAGRASARCTSSSWRSSRRSAYWRSSGSASGRSRPAV